MRELRSLLTSSAGPPRSSPSAEVAGHTLPVRSLEEAIERSAAPAVSRLALDRLVVVQPDAAARLSSDPQLLDAAVAVSGTSRPLSLVLETDPDALSVLAALDQRPPVTGDSVDELARWKRLEELRVAARDLLGLDPLEVTIAAISALAVDVLTAAHRLVASDGPPLAIIGMGKLGGAELNYASDIDVMFAGEGDPAELERRARHLMEVVRTCFRVDANLRPQGRAGPLVRSLGSYAAYWDRWAEAWEFQALLKARAVAGDPEIGTAFEQGASGRLWSRVFTADDLRAMRHLKARSEGELARRGLTDREVKRGRGGIRDIEFAVQLLQLVHGRLDPDLRSPTTFTALAELAAAGYVDEDDARQLADAYRFLRCLEHRLQLRDGTPMYSMPVFDEERTRIGRSLGFRDTPEGSALEQLDTTLARHQSTVRAIHERLYFRPLLEAFAAGDEELLRRPGAVEARLSAFGFSEGLRTQAAVRQLTRGFNRSSRLMQQILPLILGWLSESPDPDLGLLNVRNLFDDVRRSAELTRAARESPEAARRLCHLVGTTRLAADILQRNPDLVARLPDADRLATRRRSELVESATLAIGWREEVEERQRALRRWKDRHLLGVIGRDVLHGSPVADVGGGMSAIAEASLEAALPAFRSSLPLAVIALGRFGGAELSYASDLDVVFVYDGAAAADFAEATRLAMGLRRFVDGPTPAERIWNIDLDLRPEGKQGPVARSLEAYADVLPPMGARVGAPGHAAGPAGGRRPRCGPAFHGAARGVRVGAGSARRRRPRDPSNEGPGGTGTHPAGQRSGVPSQARPGFALRRRVDRAAPAAAIGDPLAVHHGRPRRPRRRRRRRRCRCAGAGHRLPVLRGDPQPPVPGQQRSSRFLAASGVEPAPVAGPLALDVTVAAPRGLPPSHPSCPRGGRAPLLRPAVRDCA